MADPSRYVWFQTGEGTGLVGSGSVVLVGASAVPALLEALWKVVECGLDFDAVVAVLGDHPFASLPDLGLASWEDGTCRVLVRGAVTASMADGEAGTQSVGGTIVRTWAEHALAGAGPVTLALGREQDAATSEYRVGTGWVPAGVLVVPAGETSSPHGAVSSAGGEDPPRPITPDEPAEPPPSTPLETEATVASEPPGEAGDPVDPVDHATADEPADEAPGVAEDTDGPVEVEAASVPSSAEFDSGATLSADDLWRPPALTPDHRPEPAAAVRGAPERDVPLVPEPVDLPSPIPSPGSDPGGAYDHLFGATQFRSVEGAAVRLDDPEADDEPTRVVDDRPSVGPDHDGTTVTFADIRELLGTRDPVASPVNDVAAVPRARQAIRCPAGHLNSARANDCRVCAMTITEHDPVTIEAPSLGTFRFSTGLSVEVTRPMLIGRSPKLGGAIRGDVPELVTLPSPSQDISRTHLEVQVDNWDVWLFDKGSTNGTMVRVGDRPPQRLRPEHGFPLPVGATVDLAGEVEFTFVAEQ